MNARQYKIAKKAVVNKRPCRAGEYNVYTVTCPFCKSIMQYDFNNILMFRCWTCKNKINLMDKNGKQAQITLPREEK